MDNHFIFRQCVYLFYIVHCVNFGTGGDKIVEVLTSCQLDTRSRPIHNCTAVHFSMICENKPEFVLKGQGHQDHVLIGKGHPMRKLCTLLLGHFKGTKAMARGHGAIAFVASVKYQA